MKLKKTKQNGKPNLTSIEKQKERHNEETATAADHEVVSTFP